MQPTKKYRAGLVSAAVFEREAEGPNGKFASKSISLQVSYKKDGEFVNNSLTIVQRNLANVINVLTQAQEELAAPSASFKEDEQRDPETDYEEEFEESFAERQMKKAEFKENQEYKDELAKLESTAERLPYEDGYLKVKEDVEIVEPFGNQKYSEEYCRKQILFEPYLWDLRFWKYNHELGEVLEWITEILQDGKEIKNCGHTTFCIAKLINQFQWTTDKVAELIMDNQKVTYRDEIGTCLKESTIENAEVI